MRKRKERYSPKAQRVLELAELQGASSRGDPNWSQAEAGGLVTPIGDVHFHWTSHHGRGQWKIITASQWRGDICGTARCRRVHVIPYGGPNESSPIAWKKQVIDRDEMMWKYGMPEEEFLRYPRA